MNLKTSIEKLDKYYERLNKGKAEKIKPNHVEKVIRKLKAKEETLHAELAETHKESKKVRLIRKIATIKEQIGRAEWLLETVDQT